MVVKTDLTQESIQVEDKYTKNYIYYKIKQLLPPLKGTTFLPILHQLLHSLSF